MIYTRLTQILPLRFAHFWHKICHWDLRTFSGTFYSQKADYMSVLLGCNLIEQNVFSSSSILAARSCSLRTGWAKRPPSLGWRRRTEMLLLKNRHRQFHHHSDQRQGPQKGWFSLNLWSKWAATLKIKEVLINDQNDTGWLHDRRVWIELEPI